MKVNFKCPNPSCSGSSAELIESLNIFPDVKADGYSCEDCGCQWRIYYKIVGSNSEIMYIPDQSEMAAVSEKIESVTTHDQSNCCSHSNKDCVCKKDPSKKVSE